MVAGTAALLVVEGLSTTSALIEVGVFTVGIVTWIAVGRRSAGGAATVQDVVSGSGDIRVDQAGRWLLARRLWARRGDVEIRQRSDDA